MRTKDISHAIAYCETFMVGSDFGERNELDMLKNSTDIPTEGMISVLKETVSRNMNEGSDIILKEMNTPEFKQYLVRIMGCE